MPGPDHSLMPRNRARNLHPRIRDSRLRSIIEVIDDNGAVGVEDLAESLGVSPATIRRDLARLADQGVITRSRGGAMRPDVGLEVPINYRRGTAVAQKRRIAAAAASLIGEGAIVGITGGTTTMEVARALTPVRKLTVVTNALNVGMQLRATGTSVSSSPVASVAPRRSSCGTDSREHPSRLQPRRSLCWRRRNRRRRRLYDARRRRGQGERGPSKIPRHTVIVADSSKIGRVTFASICPLDLVDQLITDNEADSQGVSRLEAAGLSVVLA